MYELCAFTDFLTQHDKSASTQDIKLTDLYKYLKNPYAHIEQIHRVSRYLTNKHGIIKDILRSFKSIPTLNYHLIWSSYDDPEKIRKYDKKVDDFLDDLNIKKLIRDGIYEVCELGTISLCNRKNKYIQFLELDELRIQKQRNGKWVVEYDLGNIKNMVSSKRFDNHMTAIQSLPEDVDAKAYNMYANKGDDYRYVELTNADVINIDSNRNYPYGLPYSFGAWIPLLQKEIINRVERSVSDRLIKQVVILTAGNVGGKDGKPAPKELIEHYFKQVKDLMVKKDNSSRNLSEGEMTGSGVIAIPDFFDLKTLDVDTTMFTKDLYNKIDNDIFMNLGYSMAINSGMGANYSSAQINNEKVHKYIHTILEQFEHIINGYIKNILPKSISCKIKFKKPTFADEKQIEGALKLYQSTGVIRPWIELSTGMNMEEFISMARYEKEVLRTEKYLYPPVNPFTMSSKNGDAGRPKTDNPTDNTDKSKSTGGNALPSPSD